MQTLFSINHKFFAKNPYEMLNFLKTNDLENKVDGFEVYINILSEEEKNYLYSLTELCKENNYYLQLHGESNYNLDIQKEYLDYCNELSKILERKINIVLHPLTRDSLKQEIAETNLYFSKVLNYIYDSNYNLNISIENLNSTSDNYRLSKDYLLTILSNNMDLDFTYDVGHEIVDYGVLTNLDEVLQERLVNVHIHTFNNKEDHLEIDEFNTNKEKWIKALNYLKLLKYDGPLVLEYDFYKLGNTYEERMLKYIECASFLKEYL